MLWTFFANAVSNGGNSLVGFLFLTALLRCAEQRDLAARVAGLIEAELNTGEVVWGKGVRSGPELE